MDLQEQACWLLLTFESGLPTQVVNDILMIWCRQLKRPLQEFITSGPMVWRDTCHLTTAMVQKLEDAKAKLAGQVFLAESLIQQRIGLLTVLDPAYPTLLKTTLKRIQAPPLLFYAGDLDLLKRHIVAIIGSRNAGEESLSFTRAVAGYLAAHEINVISGNARGVDRAAYDGALSVNGYTTVVLPHGIRKLSGIQKRQLQEKIEAGKVLLLSQFHPDAPWQVSRAMEHNKVVTALAQVVVVAESDTRGGTWDGANAALKQQRPLYVREPGNAQTLPGNTALLANGASPLPSNESQLAVSLASLLPEVTLLHQERMGALERPDQLSLLAFSAEPLVSYDHP